MDKQTKKNLMLAAGLLLFVVMMYAFTLVKMMHNPPVQ
jgi:hypothetical protein